jgi:VanZ family protein
MFVGLVLGAALASPARADDGFDPRDLDKQAHMAVGYAITLTTAVIARKLELPRWQAVAIGVAATAVLGTLKELVDPPYSWGDQLANTIGSGMAAGVVFAFRL